MNNQDINERIENFLQLVNQNMHNYNSTHFVSTYARTAEDHQYVIADTGRKFLRLVNVDPDGNVRSVYCFVALVDGNTKSMGSYSVGDIMKPATYKAPAKHSRGSVLARLRCFVCWSLWSGLFDWWRKLQFFSHVSRCLKKMNLVVDFL